MSTTIQTNNNKIARTTTLVSALLENYKNLRPLHNTLITNIAMLDDEFLHESILKLALPVLRHKIKFDAYAVKDQQLTMESSAIPHSLCIGFTLTCTEGEGVDASEFCALQN